MKCVHRVFPNTEISGTALFAAKIWLGKHLNHHRLKTFFCRKRHTFIIFYYILYSIEVATQKAYSKSRTPKTEIQRAIYQRN